LSESKYDERPAGAVRWWGFGRNMPEEIRGSSRTSRLRDDPGMATCIFDRSQGPVVFPCRERVNEYDLEK
jgi:hypothetical protein